MKPLFHIAIALLLVVTNFGCDDDAVTDEQDDEAKIPSQQEPVEEVEMDDSPTIPTLVTHGQLRSINLDNDTAATVGLSEALKSLNGGAHAVGALGELRGEITVWDDTVYLGHAADEPTFEAVTIDEVGDELDATIFFGARTHDWLPIDDFEPGDLESLQEQIGDWRKESEIDGALSFRITDPAATVEWHVVDGERIPDEGARNCEERKEYAHQFHTDGEPVRIVGLFTTDHTGVVVDHTTSIHAHVITDDARNGHIDELELSDEATLEVAIK